MRLSEALMKKKDQINEKFLDESRRRDWIGTNKEEYVRQKKNNMKRIRAERSEMKTRNRNNNNNNNFFSLLITGVNRAKMTSRISSHPLNDNTSNKAKIPFPSESKLNRRGLALKHFRNQLDWREIKKKNFFFFIN